MAVKEVPSSSGLGFLVNSKQTFPDLPENMPHCLTVLAVPLRSNHTNTVAVVSLLVSFFLCLQDIFSIILIGVGLRKGEEQDRQRRKVVNFLAHSKVNVFFGVDVI